MQNFEQIVLNSVHFLASALFFSAVSYGELKYFKKGRPIFYQFVLLGLLSAMLSMVYDIITFMFFESSWDGFSLSTFATLGFALMFVGSMVELFKHLEERGVTCSFARDFGLCEKLLAIVPIAVEIYLFFMIVKIDPVRINNIWLGISIFILTLPTYLAALLLFRKDNGSGNVRSLRPFCFGMILFQVLFLNIYYSMFIGGLVYCIAIVLFGVSAVFLVAELERGSKNGSDPL